GSVPAEEVVAHASPPALSLRRLAARCSRGRPAVQRPRGGSGQRGARAERRAVVRCYLFRLPPSGGAGGARRVPTPGRPRPGVVRGGRGASVPGVASALRPAGPHRGPGTDVRRPDALLLQPARRASGRYPRPRPDRTGG